MERLQRAQADASLQSVIRSIMDERTPEAVGVHSSPSFQKSGDRVLVRKIEHKTNGSFISDDDLLDLKIDLAISCDVSDFIARL